MNSFLVTLQQLGPVRLGIMGAIVLGLLMFFVFISMRIVTPEMKLLYSDLSTNDSASIAGKLEESGIPYEISSDGARIMVSGNEVGRARMLLAAEGLPNGGSMGYEIFDKQSGFGTTNFVQNINQVRALEGELSRTISSLDSIRSARVHIVLPERQLFSHESNESTASVFLGVRPGAQIEHQQILSIQSLVASAVPNLKAANVAVIDSNGNLLAKAEDESADVMSMKTEERRRDYENRLSNKIEEQVSRIVGYGKVKAIVTAEMNFDRISTNEELYDPEGQVLRSSQVTEEKNTERDSQSSDVSVANNLPGGNSDLLLDKAPASEGNKTEEVNNYEISKTLRNTVREVGEIQRLSISVLIDGSYSADADGNETYQARSQEEMDQISSLIRTAAGIDEGRGDTLEVANLQFAQIDTGGEMVDERFLLGFEKSDLVNAAEVITVVAMIALIALLVLQPMVNKIMTMEISKRPDYPDADLLMAQPSAPALAAPGMEHGPDEMSAGHIVEESMVNIAGVEGKVKASTVKKVEEIVENYPTETVSVIRSWMTQEG
ncbi:MAG: flagellar M-ring protein FliF [Alphaproteobacteria bacterium]|nr:flagellar M-ring protein FliF [Alphaproteobacteria bacterium]